MTNEIKRFSFEGKPLKFRQVEAGGEWWATAEESAPLLGYKHARSVFNLADRNKSMFRPGEQGVIDLVTPGGVQPVRVFSPRGIARLALLGRTDVSVRLHDWVIYDVIEALRAGTFVPVADHRALQARFDTLLAERNLIAGHIAAKCDGLEAHVARLEKRIVREHVVERVEREVIPAEKLAEMRAAITAEVLAALAAKPAPARAPAPERHGSRLNADLLRTLFAEIARVFPAGTTASKIAAHASIDDALRIAIAALLPDPSRACESKPIGYLLRAARDIEAGARVLRSPCHAHDGARRWRVDPVAPTAPLGRVRPSVAQAEEVTPAEE